MSRSIALSYALVASVSAFALVGQAEADIIITEVAPWSSGNSAVAVDWFELTNTGASAVTITGWRVDDDSNLFANGRALLGITSIPAGTSVIFLETANLAATSATFINTWFGGTAPAGLLFGSYSGAGVGFGTGGDQVNIFDAAGVRQANVAFGASTTGPFRTFDNAAGLNNVALTTLASVGVNGAFGAASNPSNEFGSPGVIPTPAAAALLGLGALSAGRRRR